MQFREGSSHVHREARSGWTTPEVHLVHKEKEKRKEERKGRREGRNAAVFITCPYIFPPIGILQGRGRGKLGFFYTSKGSRSIKKILGYAERNKSALTKLLFPFPGHLTALPHSSLAMSPGSRALEFLQVRLSSPGTLAWSRPRARRGKHDF